MPFKKKRSGGNPKVQNVEQKRTVKHIGSSVRGADLAKTTRKKITKNKPKKKKFSKPWAKVIYTGMKN